jgi:hypothetical protein
LIGCAERIDWVFFAKKTDSTDFAGKVMAG